MAKRLTASLRRLRQVWHALGPLGYGLLGFALGAAVALYVSGRAVLTQGEAWVVASKALPPVVNTFLGLFLLYVLVGWAGSALYLQVEAAAIRLLFGRSVLGARLRDLARQDFLLLVDALESELRVTRPFAVVLAVPRRMWDAAQVYRQLRNLRKQVQSDLYDRLLRHVREGWRNGLPSAVLLDYVQILSALEPPDPTKGLTARVLVANVTYLLGDLLEGRRQAEIVMEMGQRFDAAADGLPVFRWLASYAATNTELFLGDFAGAARSLGQLWQEHYLRLEGRRDELRAEIRRTGTTLDPIASVPRHIILASALYGQPLVEPATWPDQDHDYGTDHDAWLARWYALGLKLCVGEDISRDFTHGYVGLYHMLARDGRDEEAKTALANIPDNAALVSLYVKNGALGILALKKGDFEEALRHFRRADASSRMSGNRFLEGILLPAYAAAVILVDRTLEPELRRILRRAEVRGRLARSALYDSLLLAAKALRADADGRPKTAEILWRRAERANQGGLLRVLVTCRPQAGRASPSLAKA